MSKNLPSVFFYNSTCEMAVGNGLPHYQAPALVGKLEDDLCFLMSYLADANDWVLVNDIPSEEFKQSIIQAGFEIPKLIGKNAFFSSEKYNKIAKQSFEPWGISPAVLQKVKPHFNSFSKEYKSSVIGSWNVKHRELFSRELALETLRLILKNKTKYSLIKADYFPVKCQSVAEVDECIDLHKAVMLKAPWSSSGRGVLRLEKPQLNQSNIQWINGIIASQGFLMVEPLLNKCIDFSFHFTVDDTGVNKLGITTFKSGKNGQYQGSYLEMIPEAIKREYSPNYNESMLFDLHDIIQQAIEQSDIPHLYRGAFGVDAMLYLDENNQLRIQPCLEINLRRNMGTITLALRNQFPKAKGFWQTIFIPKGNMDKKKQELADQYPAVFKEGALVQGFLPLTEMDNSKKFASYLILQ